MWIAVTTLVAVVILLLLAVVFLLVRKPKPTNGSSAGHTTPVPTPPPAGAAPPTPPPATPTTPPTPTTPAVAFLDRWYGVPLIVILVLGVMNIAAATVFYDEWLLVWNFRIVRLIMITILLLSLVWRKQKWTIKLTVWLVIILAVFGLFEAQVLTRDQVKSVSQKVGAMIPKGSGSRPTSTGPAQTTPKIAPLPQKNSEGKWMIEVPVGTSMTDWIQLSRLGGNRTMNLQFTTDSSDPVVRVFVNQDMTKYFDYPDPEGKGIELGDNITFMRFQSRDKERPLTVLLWFVPKTKKI